MTTTTTPALALLNATLLFNNAMTSEITLQEALELVEYVHRDGAWRVLHICGNVYGNVRGDVRGNVYGHVRGYVRGNVYGTIQGRRWEFIETPFEKLKRLIAVDAPKDLVLEALTEIESQAQRTGP